MSQTECAPSRDARKHKFEVGDSVFARNFGTGRKWLAGTVITVKGQSCKVELADGRNIRRHLDHIRPCSVPHLSSAVSNSELLEVPMTADHSAEEVNTANCLLQKQSKNRGGPLVSADRLTVSVLVTIKS